MDKSPTITQLLGCQKQKEFLELFQQYVLNFEDKSPSIDDVQSIFVHLGRKNFVAAMEQFYPWAAKHLGAKLPWRSGMMVVNTPTMLQFFLDRHQIKKMSDIFEILDHRAIKARPDMFEQLLCHIIQHNPKAKLSGIAQTLYELNLPEHFKVILGRVSENTLNDTFVQAAIEQNQAFMEFLYSPKSVAKVEQIFDELNNVLPQVVKDRFFELCARRQAEALQEILTQQVDDGGAGLRRASKM